MKYLEIIKDCQMKHEDMIDNGFVDQPENKVLFLFLLRAFEVMKNIAYEYVDRGEADLNRDEVIQMLNEEFERRMKK